MSQQQKARGPPQLTQALDYAATLCVGVGAAAVVAAAIVAAAAAAASVTAARCAQHRYNHEVLALPVIGSLQLLPLLAGPVLSHRGSPK